MAVKGRRFAFLRAVNVGGRVVPMAMLKKLFESLGYTGVETFIASGNVVFDAPPRTRDRAIEERLTAALGKALGYDVPVFVRTGEQLRTIAAHKSFSPREIAAARSFNVIFVSEPLGAAETRRLIALRTANDDFQVNGREVYWLCYSGQGKSPFSNMVFEKTTGRSSTVRGLNTVTRMVAKFCGPSPNGVS